MTNFLAFMLTLIAGVSFTMSAFALYRWVTKREPAGSRALSPKVQDLLQAARRRAVVSVAAAMVAFVALWFYAGERPDLLGLPYLLMPTAAAACGLTVYVLWPPKVSDDSADRTFEASLEPRTPLSFVPRGGLIALASLVVVQVGVLVATGMTATDDDFGLSRSFSLASADGLVGAGAGPYAGWFFAVPALIAMGVLVVVTMAALWRVSSTTALAGAGLSAVDRRWRETSARVMLAVSGAALLFQFGGIAMFSGRAVFSTAHSVGESGLSTIGIVGLFGGFVLLTLSVIFIFLAMTWALRLPKTVAAEPSSTPTPATVRS